MANESCARLKYCHFFAVEFSDKYLVWSSLIILLIIFGIYLWLVLSFGPKFMAKREPYNVTEWIRSYNCFQVVICTYFIAGGIYCGLSPKYFFKCEHFGFMKDDAKFKIFVGSWLFLGLRIFEFIETIFFVLRKKTNQASFLHIFHHIGSVFMTWLFIAMHAGKTLLIQWNFRHH